MEIENNNALTARNAFQAAAASFAPDEQARLLDIFAKAKSAARAEAEHGVDSDERDELYDAEFARQLDVHKVTHEQLQGVRVILAGCEAARRRERAVDEHERAAAVERVRAAAHAAERARAPDLFEQHALDVIASLTKWHITYTAAAGGALGRVEIQGWKASGRFAGKAQGDFIVARWSPAQTRGCGIDGGAAGTWEWPDAVGHVVCTSLPSHSLQVRDAFIKRALQATATFDAATDSACRNRAFLRAAAGIAGCAH